MNTASVLTLYDYNYWAHRRVWGCVEQLSEVQFTQESDYSWGSVHSQVVHTMSAEWIWFSRLKGDSPTGALRNEEYPTRAAIRQKWDAVEQEVRAYLNSLSDADLEGDFTYQTTSGESYTHNRLNILLHVVNHGTDHRAQTLAIIDQVGGPTVEQDLLFYLREQ